MTTPSAEALLTLRPIGVVRSPFRATEGTPIQTIFAQGAEGEVILDDAYASALDDIDGFQRVWLVYWFDRASPFRARVVPFRDTCESGLLATRAPCRPNPLGLSAVRLLERSGCTLRVADVDILDGTPLLDLKPYVAAFDAFPGSRSGWCDEGRADRRTADRRFDRDADRAEGDS
jgi:tRNA-Thr(GGU) m(6)t(6)A37 methyltransferase TsaA